MEEWEYWFIFNVINNSKIDIWFKMDGVWEWKYENMTI